MGGVALLCTASNPLPPDQQPPDWQGLLGIGLIIGGQYLMSALCADGNCTNELEAAAKSGQVANSTGTVSKFVSSDTAALERFADEAPVHSVELTSFYMDEKEVTNAQYADCVDQGKCVLPQELKSKNRPKYYNNYLYADYPVIYVTWEDASSYCKWRGASLPTEAQWEYAARGGLEGYIYPWGITAPVCSAGKKNGAQFNDKDKCSNSDTVQVGLFAPNDYGLYDMAGNVWEWVADRYKTDYYRNSPLLNPPGPEDGVYRVIRGGGWESEGHFLSVAIRHRLSPGTGSQNVGFRCVREP